MIKKTKGRKIRREFSKYSKNNRMTFDVQYIVLLFKNRLIRRKEVRILFQKSRNFHLKICRGKVDKNFPIKIGLYRIKLIKKTKGRKIRRELSKYSKNNRMTFDDTSKESNRYSSCFRFRWTIRLFASQREKEREKNSTHVIESGCNAMQCTCAIVKLGQGGLHGVLDSRSA